MQTITCKKCGATFDAGLGECPVCGAVYYIIGNEAPQTPIEPPVQTAAPFGHDPAKLESIESDDIFTIHDVSPEKPDLDETRAFRPITPQDIKPLRPAAPTPTRQAQSAPQSSAPRRPAAMTAQEEEQKKAKSKLIIGAISLLALLTLVLTIMSGAFNFGDKSDAERMVSVLGMTQQTATEKCESLGLKVTSLQEASDELAGTVIKQSIKEGKKLKDGQEITLTISSGPAVKDDEPPEEEKPIVAPDLKGKTYDQAYYEATAAGLLVTTGEGVYDPDIPEGSVVSQSPKSGTQLKKGDIITLTLSKGAEASPSPETVSITALAGIGGSISPKGTVDVDMNGSMTFTITPSEGFVVREVKVDGADVGPVTTYTFSNVAESHTIYAVFTLAVLD